MNSTALWNAFVLLVIGIAATIFVLLFDFDSLDEKEDEKDE